MIIGLTGSNCSGKDTVAEYIVKQYRYTHYSLSDIIREMMKEKGIPATRENLIEFGTGLRTQYGNGVLAKKVLEKISPEDNCCITSIRHPDEVEVLRKRKDFILINVDAPLNTRFERMTKRNRSGDPDNIEKLIELEKKESQTEGSGQQLIKTANMADKVFINDYDNIESLKAAVDKMLKDLQRAVS